MADAVPWFREAIAHFYPTSTYARSLGGYPGARRKQGFQSAKSLVAQTQRHAAVPHPANTDVDLTVVYLLKLASQVQVKISGCPAFHAPRSSALRRWPRGFEFDWQIIPAPVLTLRGTALHRSESAGHTIAAAALGL